MNTKDEQGATCQHGRPYVTSAGCELCLNDALHEQGTMPLTVTAEGELIEKLTRELDEARAETFLRMDQWAANTLHTCHEQCQRPLCKANRRIAELEREQSETAERHRMQLAGISTAAIGYHTRDDSIHPDYKTVALDDVISLHEKYDAKFQRVAELERMIQDTIGWLGRNNLNGTAHELQLKEALRESAREGGDG